MKNIAPEFIDNKISFINDYINATNAAQGSKFDANANVSVKNIATLESEMFKELNIAVNRQLLTESIKSTFPEEGEALAAQYLADLKSHLIYTHDESSLKPYCVSTSMYPLLLDGLTALGGESRKPEHLQSFAGTFINFVFATAAQFAGAIATVEFLLYFDYFARRDYGSGYLDDNKTRKIINDHLEHIVYSINQPAAARGYQSCFWNISVFDRPYLEAMFGNGFVFPDGDAVDFDSVIALQEHFLTWFNKERERAILTYPVVTAAMLTDGEKPQDEEFANMAAQQLEDGNSFFIYMSESADSLASCCRLRNEVNDNTFCYSLGAGGVATGSINVITVNANRLVQTGEDLNGVITRIHKYQIAYRKLIESYKEAHMLTVYDAGFITLDKQFLTIGLNGLVEAAESQGIEASDNAEYRKFVTDFLKTIYDANRKASKESGYKFNTEFVPAENLGVKNAKWDRKDGLKVSRDCYNSYFYPVENDSVDPFEKIRLHGNEFTQFLDGGSALHLNLEQHLTHKQYLHMFNYAAKHGCNYFTFNIKSTVCNSCGHINKETKQHCTVCGSKDVDYATRIIGYLKRISSFSEPRQCEQERRYYHG